LRQDAGSQDVLFTATKGKILLISFTFTTNTLLELLKEGRFEKFQNQVTIECRIQFYKKTSVVNPGSGAFLTPDPGSGVEKIQIQDPGSEMDIPYLIFENLHNIIHSINFLGKKYLNSIKRIQIRDLVNPGYGMEKSRIWNGKKSDPG
jgi:hypothetical protein